MFLLSPFLLSLGLLSVNAYVPALPTNSTQGSSKQPLGDGIGVNKSDTSQLTMFEYPNKVNNEYVSYQLARTNSTGVSKGVLVRLSEEALNNDTTVTSTPWIALVSCDSNGTRYSFEDDIFTLARDRGATAAVLYSEWSDSCVINSEYTDPDAGFEQILDIFATQSLAQANIIQFLLKSLNGSFLDFNASHLNDYGSTVNATIARGSSPADDFLYGILVAANATDNATLPGTDSGNGQNTSNNNQHSGANTSLAMIVLYSITGCVSALFLIVILTGAIRAIRHPERYGLRLADQAGWGAPPQSRARGLTRAILETFPIVKFSGGQGGEPQQTAVAGKTVDLESLDLTKTHLQMEPLDGGSQDRAGTVSPMSPSPVQEKNDIEQPAILQASGSTTAPNQSSADVAASQLEALGSEICPICLIEFEEGEDLRVLPCEAQHRFHLTCIDPWLTELSSSCPLCRHDFQTLETMMAGSEAGHYAEQPEDVPEDQLRPRMTAGQRLSMYLRLVAQRRRRRSYDEDPTYPDTPYHDRQTY